MIDVSISKEKLNQIVYFFPFGFLIISCFIFYVDGLTYWRLFGVLEYGVFEWLQAICYFIAFYVGFKSSRILNLNNSLEQGEFKRINIEKYLMIIFSLAMFIIAMEEISWGQHIFKWNTPAAIKEINLQDETNIHNLIFIHGNAYHHKAFILIGLYGALSHFVSIYFNNNLFQNLIIVDKKLSYYFLPTALFYAYFDWINPFGFFVIQNHQELFETLLAMGFLLLAIDNHIKIKNHIEIKK